MLKIITVNSIIQFIEDNLEKKAIRIDDLVVYSGYSRRYLQMAFKKHIHIPVGKYIRLRRASRAAALLRLTRLSIIEISERFFYDSQQSFTREFKKIFNYTPRQYRINNYWSFQNLLGRRTIDGDYLKPKICYLRPKKTTGKYFNFKDVIIYTGVSSKDRWGKIYNYLKENKHITVSNKIPFDNDGQDILARTVVWTNECDSNCCIETEEGVYAHFSFSGSFDDYIHYMYNIYYNSLPLYNINKKESYDIEVIKTNQNGFLNCHYFIPIHTDQLVHHDGSFVS